MTQTLTESQQEHGRIQKDLKMIFKRWMAAALVAAAGMGGGLAHAQEVSVSAKDLKALLERVEAAEARIQELESQRAPARQIGRASCRERV